MGLGGVRVVTLRGLAAITDPYGRFHITCAVAPREGRGSNFVLKLDDRTLPTGFRMSTRQVQVQRADPRQGAALPASARRSTTWWDLIWRTTVFEPDSTEMRAQWKPRIDKLLEQLKKGPATLRLSYIADVEDKQLVDDAPGRGQGGDHRGLGGPELATSSRSSRRCSGVAAVRRRSRTLAPELEDR